MTASNWRKHLLGLVLLSQVALLASAPLVVLAADYKASMVRAAKLVEAGDSEHALQIYNSILHSNPNDFEARHLRGDIIFMAARWSECIPDELRLVQINPKYQHAYVLLGVCYLQLKQYRLSRSMFDRAIAVGGVETGTAHRYKAMLLAEIGDVVQARSEIKTAMVKDVGLPQLKTANEGTAEMIEEKASQLPLLPMVGEKKSLLKQAEALESNGQGDKSLKLIDTVLAEQPDNARAHALKGRILADGMEWDRAIIEMNKAVVAIPSYQHGYIVLSRCHLQLEQQPQALAAAEKAIKLNGPETGLAYHEKGQVLLKLGRFKEAREQIDMALKMHKDAPSLFADLFDRAQADRALKDYAGEVQDLTRRLDINKFHHADWQARGDAYLACGKLDLALADYQQTIKLAPGDRDALKGLLRIYKQKGDNKNALEITRQLKAVDGSY